MPSRRLEQPIVAVAIAEDPACVDMVDGRLIENLHVDDARRVLAWADAIAERATHRLTLRRQAQGTGLRFPRGGCSSQSRRGNNRNGVRCLTILIAGECVDWSSGLCANMRKQGGPAFHRPSFRNLQVAGSSPAAGSSF